MLPGCEKSLLFATEHIRQFFVLAVRTLVIRSSRVWKNAGGSCARLFCSHFENFSRHSERSLSSSALGGIQLRGCNCFFEVLLGRAATLPTWEHVPVDGTHVFVPTIAPLKCCLSLSAKKVTRGSTNSYVKRRLVTQGGWYAVGIGTVLTARSRLYRNEFLQENMHLKALAEIYTTLPDYLLLFYFILLLFFFFQTLSHGGCLSARYQRISLLFHVG